MSAVVNARKVGVAAAPLLGPANKVFTACVVSAPVNVPLLVTGEPDTDMMDGNDKATDVTYDSAGISAVPKARKVGTPANPLGAPKK